MNVSYREQSYLNAICMMSNIIGGAHWNYEELCFEFTWGLLHVINVLLEGHIWSICKVSGQNKS